VRTSKATFLSEMNCQRAKIGVEFMQDSLTVLRLVKMPRRRHAFRNVPALPRIGWCRLTAPCVKFGATPRERLETLDGIRVASHEFHKCGRTRTNLFALLPFLHRARAYAQHVRPYGAGDVELLANRNEELRAWRFPPLLEPGRRGCEASPCPLVALSSPLHLPSVPRTHSVLPYSPSSFPVSGLSCGAFLFQLMPMIGIVCKNLKEVDSCGAFRDYSPLAGS
jgi:hypothetical protein